MNTDIATYGTTNSPLNRAMERIYQPMARLCLANGKTYAEAEEMLKRSFIQAAQDLQPDLPERGLVSRVSATTGLNRREVTRLVNCKTPRRKPRISLASEAIARWSALPAYRNQDGTPRQLPRTGAAPSFESLARSISQDIHPRSMLEELLRLGIVTVDEQAELVTLCQTEHVPEQDNVEILGFFADNIGDHMESGVANIIKTGIKHHDQAIFADELSVESVKELAPLIRSHWNQLKDSLIPVISDMIEADRAAGRKQDQRVRVGLYSFSEEDNGATA